MTAQDRMREPWWASGSRPDDGLDESQDPFDAHRDARGGHGGSSDAGDPGPDDDRADTSTVEGGRLAADAIDLVSRLAAEAGRRIHARSTANAAPPPDGAFTRPDDPDTSTRADAPAHASGEVCDACPVCLGLRALRQARPDVITHLSDAAHHVSLALRALADAHPGDDTDGLEKIDLDQ